MTYEEIIDFHGHSCPGLAIGYRLADAAMQELGVSRSDDEELFAVVESDACGVDALQCVSGCTFGKGNLIFRDYGKHAYRLFSRVKKQGVRVLFHGGSIPEALRADRPAFAAGIMAAQRDGIISVAPVPYEELQTARVRQSVLCCSCGEPVMDSRTTATPAGALCIPCGVRITISK